MLARVERRKWWRSDCERNGVKLVKPSEIVARVELRKR